MTNCGFEQGFAGLTDIPSELLNRYAAAIDPAIYPIVCRLVEEGYITYYSCSGHPNYSFPQIGLLVMGEQCLAFHRALQTLVKQKDFLNYSL